MKITACSSCAPKNTTNRDSGWATMNCVPMTPARKPTMVFASPPMPDDAGRQGVLHQPGKRAGQQAGRPARTPAPRRPPRPARDRPPPCRRIRNRPSVVCSVSATTVARITPAAFTSALPRRFARRRRRQHHQHFFEAREIDRRPHQNLAGRPRRSCRRVSTRPMTKPFG